jgi:hypothetical protein
MNFLIAGFLLINFNAGFWWWLGYFLFAVLHLISLIFEIKKEITTVKDQKKPQLLKANGEPYTEADLEFIWKHGYQSALEMVQQTKQ